MFKLVTSILSKNNTYDIWAQISICDASFIFAPVNYLVLILIVQCSICFFRYFVGLWNVPSGGTYKLSCQSVGQIVAAVVDNITNGIRFGAEQIDHLISDKLFWWFPGVKQQHLWPSVKIKRHSTVWTCMYVCYYGVVYKKSYFFHEVGFPSGIIR